MQRKQHKQQGNVPTDRSEEIQRQIQALSSRDWQLWSIGLLVMLVVSSGVLALIFPTISWHRDIAFDDRMLPQFFFGLITLIALFNIYVINQKRTVNATRHELIRELIFNERLESMSMMDTTTQLLNQRGIDQALSHELARANRLGTGLSLMMMKLETLPIVNARFGRAAGDEFITQVAKLLRTTFRGSDIVARFSADEFLAILPNTTEQQAERARNRIQEAIDNWNLVSNNGCEISIAYGIASHVVGASAEDLLRAASRSVLRQKPTVVPMLVPIATLSGKPAELLV